MTAEERMDELRSISSKGKKECLRYLREKGRVPKEITITDERRETMRYFRHEAATFEYVKMRLRDDAEYGFFMRLFDLFLQGHGFICGNIGSINYLLRRAEDEETNQQTKAYIDSFVKEGLLTPDTKSGIQGYRCATLERLYKETAETMQENSAKKSIDGQIGAIEKDCRKHS